jgi:hypothetical protein
MISNNLENVLIAYKNSGLNFLRIERLDEDSPLALVWYTLAGSDKEIGARIDLHKQAFLDEFGVHDRAEMAPAARLIVEHLQSQSTDVNYHVATT